MTWLVGLMTAAVGFPTASTDGGDRAATEITQRKHLRQNSGPPLFETGKRFGHTAPPILTYHYVRITTTKKENR
jgi:hypothetical protein